MTTDAMSRDAMGGARTSLAQQGIWFTTRAADTGSAYHLAMTFTVRPALDVPRLMQAWAAVVGRHPVLRCAVRDEQGVPVLVPAQPPAVQFRAVAADDLDATVANLVRADFDLTAGPLARFAALTVDDGSQVLVLVVHHLVFDGTSKELLAQALTSAYNVSSTVDGRVKLEDRAAARQAGRIAEGLGAARDFWAERWREPGDLVLPGFESTPGGVQPGSAIALSLPGGTVDGATRFETLLAGVYALLTRYGTADPVVAIDLSTRDADTADRIGCWVNELPVAVVVDAEASFRDLVAGTRAALRATYPHREVPLGRAVPGLPPRPALAPVSVSYRRRPADSPPGFAGHDTSVDWLVFPHAVRNALHLHLVDGPDGVTGTLQLPASVPTPAGRRIAEHLNTLLAMALAEPDTAIADLLLLGPDERAQLAAGNETTREWPAGTVVDLVNRQAAATPDAVALEHDSTRMTYAELASAARRIANGLVAQGIHPGDLIGICAERGPALVTGVLGVLTAGAGYLPLDPAYPLARLEFIARDAGARLILGDAGAPLPGVQPLDGFLDLPDTDPGIAVAPESLAYTIYTSGSTGQPKGVQIPHAALTNLLHSFAERLDSKPEHRWLSLTSLSFDISGLELFLPLISGGRIVIAPQPAIRDGAALRRLIDGHGVTHVQATPTSWQLLLAADFHAPGVTALCGGEALPLPLATQLRSRVGRLLNVYGPTETTIWSTAAEIPPAPQRVPLGGPLANTTLHVLDKRLQALPLGVPGELCIGGAGLARGYLGREELTAQRFVPLPGTDERVYRTGDLVRLGHDGELTYLGRLDSQVKLRGHRIELGEIEQTLLRSPGVSQAAVTLDAESGPEPRLLAYLVSAVELDEPGLRGLVAQALPRYMAPAAYLRLPALPLTPNGKLDRRSLPIPAAVAAQHGGSEGGSDLIAAVTAIWQEVLQIDDIAPDDTLFDLGGHSLTIMQITARITKNLGVDVPFDVFFDTPTIEGIAECVEELLAAGSTA